MSTPLDFSLKNHKQRLAGDADQVEFNVLTKGSTTLDSGVQDEQLAGAMEDFSIDVDDAEWIEKDIANDSATVGVADEIQRRIALLGDMYPFFLDGNALCKKENYQFITYQFCLAISVQRNITSKPFTDLPRSFELIAQKYCTDHLGPYAKSEHTGWPRSRDDQPKSYKDFAAHLNKITQEWFWQPAAELIDADSSPIKDNGVDFITWLESPDKQPGQLFILGQCACGEDWDTKFSDIQLHRLQQWFHPIAWTQPVKAFCTPYALVKENLYDASGSAGLVYDRIRLAALAKNHEASLTAEYRQRMQKCIELVVKN